MNSRLSTELPNLSLNWTVSGGRPAAPAGTAGKLHSVGTTRGNCRGAPSRICFGCLSPSPAMACASRDRASLPVVAGCGYIQRICVPRRP